MGCLPEYDRGRHCEERRPSRDAPNESYQRKGIADLLNLTFRFSGNRGDLVIIGLGVHFSV